MRIVFITLAAAAVGAGIALLWAPQSGERTRRQIRYKAEDLARNAGEQVLERGADTAHYIGRRFRSKVRPALAAVAH